MALGLLGVLVGQVVLAVGLAVVAARRIQFDGSPDELTRWVEDTVALATSGPGLVLGLLTQWAAFVGAPLYASHRKGRRSLGRDFGFVVRWRPDLLLGAGLAVGMQAVLAGVGVVARHLGIDTAAADNSGLVTAADGVLLVALIAAAVVGAPVVEELFFRGLMLRALLRRLAALDLADPAVPIRGRIGPVALSIVVTALVFGALHAPFSGGGSTVPASAIALLTVQTGLLGLVFAVVAVGTRRIGPTIIAHVVFNAVSIGLALGSPG